MAFTIHTSRVIVHADRKIPQFWQVPAEAKDWIVLWYGHFVRLLCLLLGLLWGCFAPVIVPVRTPLVR
jgi:hypothetical protein